MKKIIALALALIMALSMASVAFAATYTPGQVINLTTGNFVDATGASLTGYTGAVITKDDFKIEYKFETGNTLVDYVKINDNAKAPAAAKNTVEIGLKESYTMNKDKALVGTITLITKEAKAGVWNKDTKFVATLGTKVAPLTVNNVVTPVYGAKKVANAEKVATVNANTVYVCDEDNKGYVKFDYADFDLTVTLNMKADEKVYMALDTTSDDYKELVETLEDKYEDATLQVIKFEAAPEFSSEATFELADYYFDSDATVYNYVDGKLIKIDTKWDDEEDVLSWTADEVGTLVISDVEIVAAAEEEATKNPDTGANDVVGVAAALAVVSLVAAGAVSLKK